jgi:photosystem II stability/assembly factor-like uncharacterized protein
MNLACFVLFAPLAAWCDGPWRLQETGSEALLLAVSVQEGGVCVAVGGGREDDPAVILLSEDGGASWQRREVDVRARLYDVHFPTNDVGYAVGLQGTVLKTTDGGRNWSRQKTGSKSWLATVFFLDAERGFVAGSDQVLATRNGGARWTLLQEGLPVFLESASIRDLIFVNPDTGFLVGDEGLLCKTIDGGVTWVTLETGTRTWLRSISFVDVDVGYVAGAQGLLLATRDGGATWEHRPHPGGKLNGVAFLDAEVGLTTTMEGDLYRTEDRGATWTRAYRSTSGALAGISNLTPEGLFVVGGGGVILRRDP